MQTYRENARKYRSRCEKEQRSKVQQIKIMRKTHESHLKEKRQLIRNLQDIIEEQEIRISELEGEVTGKEIVESRGRGAGEGSRGGNISKTKMTL